MRKFAFVLAIVPLLLGSAFAQQADSTDFGYRGLSSIFGLNPYYDFNSSGFGARSKAMGGVYMALYNDGFSSFLNPASMIHNEKSAMSLDVVNSQDNSASRSFGAASDVDGDHTRLIQAGAIAPFTYFDRDWWVGGGYRTVYDMHNEFTLPPVHLIFGGVDYTTVYTYEQTRGVDALNLALAGAPVPELSQFALGINLNVFVRGYRGNLWGTTTWTDTLTGNPMSAREHHNDKSTFSGASVDIGALVDLDMLKFGLKVTPAYTLSQSVVFTTADVNPYGEDVGLINRIDVNNKFPLSFAAGLSYTPYENLTLAADIEQKPLSDVRIDVDPESGVYSGKSNFNPGWEDLTQFRLGAEYVLDAGFARIPVRAGAQNLPSIMRSFTRVVDYTQAYIDSMRIFHDTDVADSITYGDQINTNLFSFGAGLKFERIWFDIAYQFGSSNYSQTDIDYNYLRFPFESGLTSGVRFSYNSMYLSPSQLDYSRLYFSMGMLF